MMVTGLRNTAVQFLIAFTATFSLLTPSALGQHHEPHAGDPLMAGEHADVVSLFPPARANFRARANGAWSQASTWQGGRIPGNNARVFIPENIRVVFDANPSARLDWLRVDGDLVFSRTRSTKLLVDTLFTAPTGRIEVGSKAAPILANVTAEIIITDTGAIDSNWDRKKLTRGLILHGKSEFHGTAKTAILRNHNVSRNRNGSLNDSGARHLGSLPQAGVTSLRLNRPVINWRVGDHILIPGVKRPTNSRGLRQPLDSDEDEQRQITRISADRRTIFWSEPLAYDHIPPVYPGVNGLPYAIANLTRNVLIASEATATNRRDRRGHLMFMHSPDASMKFVHVDSFGRTRKDIRTTDHVGGRNPRGRYAVHFHRTGLADGSHLRFSQVEGNVVTNATGWGIVSHSSVVQASDNVVYRYAGAGIVVGEVGDTPEAFGVFERNLVARSTIGTYTAPSPSGTANDKGTGLGFGSGGIGFWSQGASLAATVRDNLAIAATTGFFLHARPEHEAGRNQPALMDVQSLYSGALVELDRVHGHGISPLETPIGEFSNNGGWGNGVLLQTRWKEQAGLGESVPSYLNKISHLKGYANISGISMGYSNNIAIENCQLIGFPRDEQIVPHLNLDDHYFIRDETRPYDRAILPNRNYTGDLRVRGCVIGGYPIGVVPAASGFTLMENTKFVGNIIDMVVTTPQAISTQRIFSDEQNRLVIAKGISHVRPSATQLGGLTHWKVKRYFQMYSRENPERTGRPHAASSSVPSGEFTSYTALDLVYYNGSQIFDRMQRPNEVPFASKASPNFFNSAKYRPYRNKTNRDLQRQFGLQLGGAFPPASARDGRNQGIDALVQSNVKVPAPTSQVSLNILAPRAMAHINQHGQVTIDFTTRGIQQNRTFAFFLSYNSGRRVDPNADRIVLSRDSSQGDAPKARLLAADRKNPRGLHRWRIQYPHFETGHTATNVPIAAGAYSLLVCMEEVELCGVIPVHVGAMHK